MSQRSSKEISGKDLSDSSPTVDYLGVALLFLVACNAFVVWIYVKGAYRLFPGARIFGLPEAVYSDLVTIVAFVGGLACLVASILKKRQLLKGVACLLIGCGPFPLSLFMFRTLVAALGLTPK